ncbi:MAG: NAD-dependent epimerase/dehydratase family protein [Patescibacteria group bacterium]|jgi:nucleoside-diphosphate-sugar epimerase
MNILIAGGCGFIGSNLTKHLLNTGHSVTVIDNLITSSVENIKQFSDNKSFLFINADITSHKSFEALSNIEIDLVYHLASPASPIQYARFPLETLKANSMGTSFLLELAHKKKARLVYASTSEIYGDPLEHPQKETYWGNVNTRGPRSCYDESKRLGETLCYVYHSKYGVDTRTVRIFNTYGPNMEKEDGRVISNFIVQSLTDRPITIYGDGSQTRSFCYVEDLVLGLVAAGQEPIPGEVVNLGNPMEHTIHEIALLIKKLTASDSEIVFKKLPQDDPKKRNPHMEKVHKLLGWQPVISLEQGLQYTITYFKNRFSL